MIPRPHDYESNSNSHTFYHYINAVWVHINLGKIRFRKLFTARTPKLADNITLLFLLIFDYFPPVLFIQFINRY